VRPFRKSEVGSRIVAAICLLLCACGKPSVARRPVPAPTPTPAPEPWTVLCDSEGHYTFVFEGGSLWDLREWDDYESAAAYMNRIRRQLEFDKAHPSASNQTPRDNDEFAKRRDRIGLRNWQKCPGPPPAPTKQYSPGMTLGPGESVTVLVPLFVQPTPSPTPDRRTGA
jgi:hypothetical protein